MSNTQLIQCPHCRSSLQIQLQVATTNFVCPTCNNPFSFQAPVAHYPGGHNPNEPSPVHGQNHPVAGQTPSGGYSAQPPQSGSYPSTGKPLPASGNSQKKGMSGTMISAIVIGGVLLTVLTIGGIGLLIYFQSSSGSKSKAKKEEAEFLQKLESATKTRKSIEDTN